IFRVMSELYDKGEPIDLLAVTNRLLSQQLIDDVGGVQYLTKVAQSVPTAANISYYCKIIEEKAVLRRLIQTATDIITSSFEEGDNVESLLDEAEKNILEVSSKKNAQSFKAVKDVLLDVYGRIEDLHKQTDDVT